MKRTFSDFIDAVALLEALLVRMGIATKAPSSFQKAREILVEMDGMSRGSLGNTSTLDQRENWRRGFSLGDLAMKLVAVQGKPDFHKLRPHLEFMAADSDLSLFSFAPKEDQRNDFIFELRIAACMLQILAKCQFDEPKAKNTNKTPDVIGDFRGMRWAIECKTLHPQSPKDSQHPEGFLQRVNDARDQIETAVRLGSAQSGLVIINMKNTTDHDSLFPTSKLGGDFFYLPYGSIEQAENGLAGVHDRFITEIRAYLSSNGTKLADLFVGTKVTPQVLFVYSSIVGVIKDSRPTFTMLRVLACEPEPLPDTPSYQLMQALNNCLQDAPDHPPLQPVGIG